MKKVRTEVVTLKRGDSQGGPTAGLWTEEFFEIDGMQGEVCQPECPG